MLDGESRSSQNRALRSGRMSARIKLRDHLSACFAQIFKILLSDSAELIERVSRCVMTESRSLARGCNESAEPPVIDPLMDELQNLDRH